MHHRLIVLVDVSEWKNNNDNKGRAINVRTKKRFKDSLEVRKFVYGFMVKEGFCTQERFAQGPSDWFKIGGRWSGTLTKEMLNQLLWKSCEEELEDNANKIGLNSFYSGLEKSQREKGEAIFKSFFPRFKNEIPVYRNEYRDNGYEDDAMIVNQKLWIRFILNLIQKSSDNYHEDPLIYLDGLIDDLTAKNTIDLKWAVVIDYHN